MRRKQLTKSVPLRVVLVALLLIVVSVSFFTVHVTGPRPAPVLHSTAPTLSKTATSATPLATETPRPTPLPLRPPRVTPSPGKRGVLPLPSTALFREPGDEVDCELLQSVLVRLYEESKVRRAAWSGRGYTPRVVAPSGKQVEELHILTVGDSWGRLGGWSIVRYLDTCRMRMPAPLLDRDECSLYYFVDEYGHGVYQLSKAALGLAPGVAPEDAGILRINVHYHRKRYTVEAAQYLETILRSGWPTPSANVYSFPRRSQCRQDGGDRILNMHRQLPMCLCEDTLELEGNGLHRVPVDAIQVFTGMWDTQIQEVQFDEFAFNDPHVDWFFRRKAFAPNLTVYPYMTWEENVKRFRRFMVDSYVTLMRSMVKETTVPDGVPMPRVLLSRIPRVNCYAPKFRGMPTLNSTERCMLLAWPLHDVVDDVVRAAYGEALLGLPAVPVPEWLRLVNYKPLSVTETIYSANYNGVEVAPNEFLCTMGDGAHLDTGIFSAHVRPHYSWCARKAHLLFWRNMRNTTAPS